MENFKKPKDAPVYGDPERQHELRGDGFLKHNTPGDDLFDEALGEDGKLVMPGSTINEGAGTYFEHKGPNDLRHTETSGDAAYSELDPEVRIKSESELDDDITGSVDELTGEFNQDDEEDAAAKWLRENDPDWK